MNEQVRKDLVRGIPKVEFSKDGLCDACQKGKQIKVSFRKKFDSTIEEPLQLLHMDLFGLVNILSISKKSYCLVIVDDFSKFSWTYFLKSKDEASEIIINHIRQVNNHPNFKVRRIRSDNGTEFKNYVMRLFCEENGIMHEFSAARTPQQNGVVERKNRSLIEVARTMLEESKLTIYFKAKAFDAKADEGIFIGYAVGKTYRIYNLRTNIVIGYVEMICEDSDDESDQEPMSKENAENSTTNEEEPKKVEEALLDPDWVLAMQEELNRFERNKVWNPVQHSRTKYIDIKYHFIREHVMNGNVELHFVPSEKQLADIFTKPLDESTFTRLVSELGLMKEIRIERNALELDR
ncbi:hypothetical protein AgCh_013995 [Apium graveolens]